MLNYIESNILNIFYNIYELKMTNCINDKMPNMNIIFDEEHIPNMIIDKFLINIKDYIPNILEYALIHALLYSNKNIINKFKDLKKNINNINTLNYETKRNIIYCSIKYLLTKKRNYIDEKEIEVLKNKHIELFSNINNLYDIKTINKFIRVIIEDLLDIYSDDDTDLIENILLSNKYDNEIRFLSKGFIENNNDIKIFKIYLLRIFFYDLYIIENYSKKEIIDNLPNNLDENSIIVPSLKFIEGCIKNNYYSLPKDIQLRKYMISRFILGYFIDKKEILEYSEKKEEKKLKKIYPLYKLDKLD